MIIAAARVQGRGELSELPFSPPLGVARLDPRGLAFLRLLRVPSDVPSKCHCRARGASTLNTCSAALHLAIRSPCVAPPLRCALHSILLGPP
eukprot:2002284-Prymnesium_polylepis.1